MGHPPIRPPSSEHSRAVLTWRDQNRGGEEVLLDVGGQDATEAFEDVGHSDEAREILDNMLIGDLKRQVCISPNLHSPSSASPLNPSSASRPFHSLADALRKPGDPSPKATTTSTASGPKSSSDATGLGIGVYALILVGGVLAFVAYQFLASSPQSKTA